MASKAASSTCICVTSFSRYCCSVRPALEAALEFVSTELDAECRLPIDECAAGVVGTESDPLLGPMGEGTITSWPRMAFAAAVSNEDMLAKGGDASGLGRVEGCAASEATVG